jgi:hypothetical protein
MTGDCFLVVLVKECLAALNVLELCFKHFSGENLGEIKNCPRKMNGEQNNS